jgi:uncharacterized membrane protein YfcA
MIWEWLILLVIGWVAGTVGSLVGLGGGIVIVPSLAVLGRYYPEFRGITPPVAVGTSLLLIVLTALASTLSYARQRRVDFGSGWIFFLGCGPGAVIGAYLTRFFHSDAFFAAFGVVMIFVSFMLRIKEKGKPRRIRWDLRRTFLGPEGESYEYGLHRLTAWIISFFVGIISGLFGIGGGSLLVPMMILLFGFPPHVATATSMWVIFLTSCAASVTHFIEGNIYWYAAAFLAPGAWLGGRLGAWVSSRLSSRALLTLLRAALVVVAMRMITSGLHLV